MSVWAGFSVRKAPPKRIPLTFSMFSSNIYYLKLLSKARRVELCLSSGNPPVSWGHIQGTIMQNFFLLENFKIPAVWRGAKMNAGGQN
jgi:hypothetical protein